MSIYKRSQRCLAAVLSAVMLLGMMPIVATASTAGLNDTYGLASSAPVKVVQIAAAQNNSIALKSDGTVIAWGNQSDTWAKLPEGLKDVIEIYAKDAIFLARKSNGTVVAWGSNEASETTVPNGLSNVISMAGANHHTLVVQATPSLPSMGRVVAWGLNGNGQSTVPAEAQSGIVKVAAGSYYSMALKFNGTVVDWGSNGADATSKPADLNNVAAIDAGSRYALALKQDGTVVAWGQNDNDLLALPGGLTNVIAISAGQSHALALKGDGTVVGWGNNASGKATPPASLNDVVAISAGINHSLALKRDGTVVSWGAQTSVPGDNELQSLTLAEGSFTPGFSSSVTSYHYDLSPETSTVHIRADLNDPVYSALYINDQLRISGQTVALPVPNVGAEIKVRVEPYMKPPKTYTLTLSRDREPPSVTFSPNGSAAPARSITTLAQVTDATSGVDGTTLEYIWTQTASAPAGGWAEFSLLPHTQFAQFTHAGADGNWYLHIRARDYAGNPTAVTSLPFPIDNTPPVVSVTMETADGNAYVSDTWTNQNVVITAGATDALSGVAAMQYTLDGGKTWADYSAPITISGNGIHTVILQVIDAAGNVTVESRTVKITTGDLELTLTMEKIQDGGSYASGEWTNNSVRVSAVAQTGTHDITSFIWSMNGGEERPYDPGSQTIIFFQDGMNEGVFKVTDEIGNSLSVPYAINIDKTAPTVSFSPNGDETAAQEISVTATVADSGGSGLAVATLEYVWTQTTDSPTEGWQPLNNGSALTKVGADGDWYLHVQGKDTAGNSVYDISNRFVLYHPRQNSSISPDTGSFDQNAFAQEDVATMMTLNGNTLVGISSGAAALVQGTDYIVTGNMVTLLKSYLAAQPVGTTNLTFTFSAGANQTLHIMVSDTTLPSGTAPSILTAVLPGGTVDTAYSRTFTATGDTPITWTVDSGSLPNGLNLLGNTISGTPTTTGTFHFTIKAINATGSDAKPLSIVISSAAPSDGPSGGNNSSSNGSGSSGGSNTPVTQPPKKPDQPVSAEWSVPANVDKNDHAAVTLTEKSIADGIQKALSAAKEQGKAANGIGLAANITLPNTAKSIGIILPQNVLKKLTDTGVEQFEISISLMSLTFNLEALKEIRKQSTGDVTIHVGPAQNLSATAKKLIGTRPVFDVTISCIKNGKTLNITSLGGGSATLSIPYTPGKKEAAGYLFGVYVDAKGNAARTPDSAYDAGSGRIILNTNHFSGYGVGYTAPSANFTDISPHWAKESIDYVVGRGLLAGTSKTTFDPDAVMTRGMLVTALGRLAGVDVTAYKGSSFTDVKGDNAFRPYIEWAYKKGVVQGIGNNQFAPDRAVTREEIAVIFANYAKATGYPLPVTREETTYADASSIGSAYKTAVTAMQQAGIMMGGLNNDFNPKAGATRAEVSSMLHRYVKLNIDPATAQGWALNDDGRYLYYKDGKALTGTQAIDGAKYFFHTDGTLKTGWVKDGDNWRYYSGNTAAVDWLDISGKLYYFTKDGLIVAGKWYCFYSDGSLAKNAKINGYEVDENGIRKTK